MCVTETDKERQKEIHRQRARYVRLRFFPPLLRVFICVCVCVCIRCVGETAAQSLQTTTAADEACGPPDEHSDHSPESLSPKGNKEKCDTDGAAREVDWGRINREGEPCGICRPLISHYRGFCFGV